MSDTLVATDGDLHTINSTTDEHSNPSLRAKKSPPSEESNSHSSSESSEGEETIEAVETKTRSAGEPLRENGLTYGHHTNGNSKHKPRARYEDEDFERRERRNKEKRSTKPIYREPAPLPTSPRSSRHTHRERDRYHHHHRAPAAPARKETVFIYRDRSGRRIYETRSDSESASDVTGSESSSEDTTRYVDERRQTRVKTRRRRDVEDREVTRIVNGSKRDLLTKKSRDFVSMEEEEDDEEYYSDLPESIIHVKQSMRDIKGDSKKTKTSVHRADTQSDLGVLGNDVNELRSATSNWAPVGQMPHRSVIPNLPDLDAESMISSVATGRAVKNGNGISTSQPITQIQYNLDFTLRKLLNEQVFADFLSDSLGRHRFREYLEATGNTVALDFWTDAHTANRLIAQIKSNARAIGTLYLTQHPEETGIPREVTEGAAVNLKTLLNVDVSFEDLQNQLLRSLYHGQFQNYIKHRLIQETAVQLGKHNLSEVEQEGLGDCFCLTNPRLPDHPIVLVSEGFCGVTGYPRSQIVGRNCRFLQGPGTEPESVDRIRKGLNSEEGCTELLLNYRRNGEPFYCLLCIIPLRDTLGNIAYFIGGQTNVTGMMTGKKSLSFLLGGSGSTTSLHNDSAVALPDMSPSMASFRNRNPSRNNLSSLGRSSVYEPRKAAGSVDVRNSMLSPTVPSPKGGMLSNIFKRGSAQPKTSTHLKQTLAGAESMVAGPARNIDDQMLFFKDTYSKVMIFKCHKREITFVTQSLLSYFGLSCLTEKDLYASDLMGRDITSVIYEGDKSETKKLIDNVKRAIKNGESLSVRCGLRMIGKQRIFTKNEYLHYKPGGSMHLTPLQDLDGSAVAYVAIFG